MIRQCKRQKTNKAPKTLSSVVSVALVSRFPRVGTTFRWHFLLSSV
jgi:hypothetical protein